jgi:regulator of sirC expression with transglutaminase-like and TPR domain
MIPRSRPEAEAALSALARAPGEAFDLTACALACAAHENPDRDFTPARRTLDALAEAARARSPRTAADFARLLFADFGFAGDRETYDDPANADLPGILERRRGLPVGLGVVWRHAARAAEAPLHGVDMPGHFILRLETDAAPVFIDPFEGGATLDRADLDALARHAGRQDAGGHLRPVSDRLIAIRLQTNLTARARAAGDVAAWERAARRRALIAPDHAAIALEHAEAAKAAGLLRDAAAAAARAADLTGPGADPAIAAAARQLADALSRRLN